MIFTWRDVLSNMIKFSWLNFTKSKGTKYKYCIPEHIQFGLSNQSVPIQDVTYEAISTKMSIEFRKGEFSK